MCKLQIKSFDFSGSVVGFIYQGKRTYHSIIGGLLSIMMMFGIIIILVAYLDVFFRRTKTKMTFEDKKYYAPPLLNLTDNFAFVVMTQYGEKNMIRNDIIKIDAVFKVKNGTDWKFKPIDSMPCHPVSDSPIDLFNKLELSKGICFNTSGLGIQGSHVTDILQFLQLNFRLCMNDTNCYSEEKIKEYIERTKPVALFYFVDATFEIYNHSNRVSEFYNYIDINLTYQNNKETNIYFSLNELLVDEHYLFPGKPVNYSRYMIESSQDKGAIRSSQETTILSFNLKSSNYKSTIHISFMQLTELLASICSLINVLIITICSIGNYFNHYLFQADLINAIFESEISSDYSIVQSNKKIFNFRENINRKSTTKTIEKKLSNNYLFKDVSPINKTNNNLPINQSDQSLVISDSFHQLIKKQQKLIKSEFSQSNVIKMVFLSMIPFNSNNRHKDYKSKFNQINQSLIFYQDLKNAYRKLMEIDLLKYLLLTEEQLTMYQLLPKLQFKNQNNTDFEVLINNPNFHFLKCRKYRNKVLNNSLNKELFSSTMAFSNNGNKLNEKLLKLISK